MFCTRGTRAPAWAELYVLRKNSATNQIIENEIRVYRDARNLQIPNAIRGTTQEWNLAKNTINDFRTSSGIGVNRNLGYLEGNINATDISSIIDPQTGARIFRSVAPEIAEQEAKVFTALEITWSRVTDSEYRMLNKLALSLEPNAEVGNIFSGYYGTINVVSERTYCTSCQGAIKQFNNMFPNINLVLIDAIKL